MLEGDGRRPPGLGDGLCIEVGLPRDGADPRVGVQHVDRRVALEQGRDGSLSVCRVRVVSPFTKRAMDVNFMSHLHR